MSDKSIYLKAYNKLFFDFLDEIIAIFPDNNDIKVAKQSFETIRKLNVTAILKAWYSYVYMPYKDRIDGGDISFFIDKDYGSDLVYLSNSQEIMVIVDKIRNPIRDMSDDNKQHSLAYLQKLSKLAVAYSQ